MSLTAPEQPDPTGQDPQATPEPPATPPAATAPPTSQVPPSDAPWANDLNALFTDEGTRGQVDQFLREKVQPYTTKLEQQAAQTKDAMRLVQDLTENPVDTYVALTEEMFGAEAAQKLLGELQQQLEASQQAPQQPGAPAPQPTDPRVEAALQYVENQQLAQHYQSELARVASDPQYADVNPDLLHTFVAAASGNFDQAVSLYREARDGFAPPPPPPEAPPEAPAVLGSDGATPPAVPTERKAASLDEAIDDFMAENRANRQAPPVGTA